MSKPTHARVVTRGSHQAHTKAFLKLVSSISHREGWREDEVLARWLDASARSMYGAVLRFVRDDERWKANEAEYMRIVDRCRHPQETMGEFAEMLAIIGRALTDEPSDVLTPIFSEISAAASLGQFFTPYDLSVVTAMMTLGDAKERLAEVRARGDTHITCSEPACGVGGMVLAGNQVMRDQGIDISRHVQWVAVDVDWRAVCGAYIQLTLTGANAIVVHGNTLTLEERLVMPTIMAAMYPRRRKRDVQQNEPVGVEAPVQGAFDFGEAA